VSATGDSREYRCGSCGNRVAEDDEFCTHCGTSLLDATSGLHLGVRPPSGSGATQVEATSRARRRWPRLAALAAVLLVVLGLIAAVVVSRLQLDDARSERDASLARAASLQAARDRIAAELAATETLSRRRAAVLTQVDEVLRGVDPLLASVDDVKQEAANIEGGGNSFVRATNALIGTTVRLVNYLVQTDPDRIDPDRVDALIDRANAQLDRVDSLESALRASHVAYTKAASRFDTKATTFSEAVEELKQQLEKVAR
jgi:hypothetical protein